MTIFVDADGCPKPAKEILYRAAERTSVPLVLVANRALWIPDSPLFQRVVVGSGLDVADRFIEENASAGDLVITADIPLAAKVVEKDALVLSPHGEIFDRETVGERLSVRNFMQELRTGGVSTGGPAPFSTADRERFANALNRLLLRKTGKKS